ncbi:MAG: hypothetical protein WCI73_16220 [Phycisphaerae bacterium]
MTTRKKISITLLASGMLTSAWLATGYVIQERWRQITVSHETTFALGPLREDGTVDYVGALNARCSAELTPANNAALVLLRATGTSGFMAPKYQEVWLQRLGAEKLPEEGEYYVDFQEFMKARAGKAKDADEEETRREEWIEREESRRNSIWAEKDDPDVAAWIKRNEMPLKWATEASRYERFYAPLVGNQKLETVLEANPGALGKYRGLANVLMARAMMHLGAGDTADYRNDLTATARLGLLVMQGPMVLHRLVGRAMMEEAYCGVGPALGGQMTFDDCRLLLDALRVLKPMPEMVEAVDQAERFTMLDMLTQLARFGPGIWDAQGEELGGPQRQGLGYSLVPVKFDDVLREYNTLWDREASAARKPTYAERNKALQEVGHLRDAISARATKRWDGLRKALDMLVEFKADFSRTYALHDQARMRKNLAELGLLLEIYRAAHGDYPNTLDMLPQDQVRGADEDFFSAKKMVYRREGKGYVLYSVGINARDDGGHELPRNPRRLPGGPGGGWTVPPGHEKPEYPDDLVLRVSLK